MKLIKSKSAVSPLIATVLLIAFAVAIGAVVLTYGGSLGECGDVHINVALANEQPDVCYSPTEHYVVIVVENGKDAELSGFKATVQGSDDIYNMDISEPVGILETKRVSFEYPDFVGELEKVKLIPVMIEGEETTQCSIDKGLIIEGLPVCS